MKVFVINGSPKGSKSNTYRLTKAFLTGMQEGAENDGETVEIAEGFLNKRAGREIRSALLLTLLALHVR